MPKTTRQQMTALSTALPTAAKKPSARRVRVARYRSGRLLATFKEVPVDELPAFIEALQAFWAAGGQVADGE